MSLYILFYEEKEFLSPKKILELDSLLMKILNNHDNIVDYLNFISSNFMVYYYLSKIKKKEIKIEKNKIGTYNINFNNILNANSSLIIHQEEQKYYFLNTSEIIDYIILK